MNTDKKFRITIIGGGSTTFVPEFVFFLTQSKSLQGSTVVLMDLDHNRLELMTSVCRKFVDEAVSSIKIESTTDRRTALTGADFVMVSIASGGFAMYECDLEIPARYGIFNQGGETVGPGGLLHACRHIPILAEICREIEELAPEAWLFNYTNPDTCVLMALERLSQVKKLSLCTCSAIPRHADKLSGETGIPPEELMAPALAGGLNHCPAVLDLRLKDGRDAFPMALERIIKPFVKEMLQRYNVLIYCAGHWTEFFTGHTRLAEPYQGRVQGLEMMYGRHVRDLAEESVRVRAWERAAKGWLDTDEGKDQVFQTALTYGERIEVIDVIEALVENKNEVHAIVTRNRGAIPNLPFDAVVEVSSVVGGYGVHPITVGPLPDPIAAKLRLYVDVFNLVVDTALTGSRKSALDALALDPQTSAVLTPYETEKMLDEMIKAEADFLPQFV